MPSYQNQANQQSNNSKPNLKEPYDNVYVRHVLNSNSIQIGLSEAQMRDMQLFMNHWEGNRGRYNNVSRQTNMPAKLIAALHWRESSGNFNTYLHQGDPLGRPAVNWPMNIPIFHNWEDAAVHAINMKKGLQTQLEMTSDTTDVASIATYAEGYNGLGYHYKEKPSPYVYSGSNQYSSGKYVRDGRYNPSVKDTQIGVLPLIGALDGLHTEQDLSPKLIDKEFAWDQVYKGTKLLRHGEKGPAVTALQERLNELGYTNTPDGDLGPGTIALVKQFQRDYNLPADGIVGPGTASKIEQAKRSSSNPEHPSIQ
jgi:lysozyme family protein